MIPPATPANEEQRMDALRALNILDTMPEEHFDRITRLACRLFQTETSLVSLVDTDRQWFKSRHGLDARETGRDISFCGHTILTPETFVVHDTHEDERFHDNPLVTGGPRIRFYAGQPLVASNGTHIGTLCTFDPKPRLFSSSDQASLCDLASIVEENLKTSAAANTDPLTGLLNRRGFSATATQQLTSPWPASMVYLDLDGFKSINDTFGHKVGDDALRVFAQTLGQLTSAKDTTARLGGDEFCVLVAGSPARACQLISGLRARLRALSLPYALRFSAGTLTFDRAAHESICDLMHACDTMMYTDKRRRKLSRVC